jgi:hypothetical protein
VLQSLRYCGDDDGSGDYNNLMMQPYFHSVSSKYALMSADHINCC